MDLNRHHKGRGRRGHGFINRLKNLWARLISGFAGAPPIREPAEAKGPGVHFIADCHFNHRRIVRYFTDRSKIFHGSVSRMNRTLIAKWNETVRPGDTVYHVGDFAWSDIGYFIRQLNGRKFFIRGNHDGHLHHARDPVILEYKGMRFLVIHDPAKGRGFDGFVIHGHVHDADPYNRFPFIDLVTRRVNVSAEVIGYRPISLYRIVETMGFMQTYGHEIMPTRRHAAWLRDKATAIEAKP